MAIADISKSLVHIQEKFIKRGTIAVTGVTVPAIAAANGIGTVTVTGLGTAIKQGDTVVFQPTASTDVVSNAVPLIGASAADGAVTLVFTATGVVTSTPSKNFTLTTIAAPF